MHDVHAGRQVIGPSTVEHDSEKTAANFVHLHLFACVHSDARIQCPRKRTSIDMPARGMGAKQALNRVDSPTGSAVSSSTR